MHKRLHKSLVFTAVVFILTLAVTVFYWSNERTEIGEKRRAAFLTAGNAFTETIHQRLIDFELLLLATKGLIESSEEVSDDEFHRFFETLSVTQMQSSLQHIAVLRYVPAFDQSRHEEEMRTHGIPEYRIRPSEASPFYAPIVYIEHFSDSIMGTLGEDLANGPSLLALERARSTGSLSLTDQSAQESPGDENSPALIRMHVPVFSTIAKIATVEGRVSSTVGWVSAAFFLHDLIDELRRSQALDADIGLEIFSSINPAKDKRLFGMSNRPNEWGAELQTATHTLELGGKSWALVLHTSPAFERRVSDQKPWVILAIGLPLSLVLGLLTWVMSTARDRAMALAEKMTQGLRVAQTDLEATLSAIPDRLFEVGLDGRIYKYRSPHRGTANVPADDYVGKTAFDILSPEAAGVFFEALRDANEHGSSSGKTYGLPLADGLRWFELSIARKESTGGNEQRFVGLIRDITERVKAEESLQLSASVFSHAHEAIMITDAQHRIIDVNESFSRITGYQREDVVGRLTDALSPKNMGSPMHPKIWQEIEEKNHWSGELPGWTKDGKAYCLMVAVSAVRNAAGAISHFIILFSDISPLKEYQQKLERIGHYDALTDLPNRVLLADRLQQALIHSARLEKPLAVAYLDLDGFKPINDTHGHGIGDQVLIAIAQRMKESLREGDTFSRIGGDEFVAVLVDLDKPEDLQPILDRLLLAAAAPVSVDNLQLNVSASIGVTIFPLDGAEADLLIRHADQAMYMAKQSGKNRYQFFDVDHEYAIKTQNETLWQVKRALERDEFVLFYQPKVRMRTGKVVGAEALIRWQHPERGLLAPGQFLPIIEGHPISVELGEWVIDTALNQLTRWHERDLKISISVNMSTYQLQRDDFVTRLKAQLAAHPDANPEFLELEILESSALKNIEQLSETMKACLLLGVYFSLDDFGTGYSSLTYLKHLPASILKIDQSFVRDMLDDPNDLAIVAGVIGLARAFHRGVIAEGVESVAHGEQLLQLGCEMAQGYAIARPLPAAEFQDWVAGWKPHVSWLA